MVAGVERNCEGLKGNAFGQGGEGIFLGAGRNEKGVRCRGGDHGRGQGEFGYMYLAEELLPPFPTAAARLDPQLVASSRSCRAADHWQPV